MRKREMRIKTQLHRLHRYGHPGEGGMSWAKKQASRRANRRQKCQRKSGYSM